MRPPILVIVVVLLVGISAALSASNLEDRDAVAAGNWRLIVPNLARDAALPAPTATPAPTYDPERWVNIQLSITAHELAVAETGLMDIHIEASISAKIPTVLEAPVSVIGSATITSHAADSAGCIWTRTITKPDLKMTVYHSGDLSVLLGIDGPEWYYMVQCPGDPTPPPLRVPQFGTEGLRYFLQYALEPFRVAEGVRLPTDIYSSYAGGQGCLKRSASYSRSAFNADVFVGVYVYQADYPGGCLLPLWP